MSKGWLALLALLVSVPLFAGGVTFQKSDGRIDVNVDGRPFTTLYCGPDAPKPYLHPLRAADGTIVTRLYPMENVEGETHDHPHHRGLWFSHGDVNGIDFWASEGERAAQEGHIVLRKIEKLDDATGTLRATFDWKGPDGKVLLTEDRTMVLSGDSQHRVIDFDATLTAGPEAVKFGDTKEGMFAIRLATPLEEPHKGAKGVERTGKIVNAEGKTGEAQTWGKRSTWVDYGGKIDGKPVGIAIFDHPANPKHPTYWHVRSYGLFAANIFGEHDFYNDKSRDGSVTLAPGKAIRFRYRVVIHSGDTGQAGIAKMYAAWANKGGGGAASGR